MTVLGWFYGTLLPLWFAVFGPLVGLLLCGETVLLRGRGRRLLFRPGAGRSGAAARRAKARCAGVNRDHLPAAVRGPSTVLEERLAGWWAVERRSEVERVWVAVVALLPLAAALVAWYALGPTRLVLFVVVLPAFCLLGMCLALLRLDRIAVGRRYSREFVDFAVTMALLACAEDLAAATRGTRAALDEAVGRVAEALDRDARYGVSLRAGMRQKLVAEAGAAAAALDAALEDLLQGRSDAAGTAAELERIRAVSEVCPLALSPGQAGPAPVVAGSRPGVRALAVVAALLVGLGILLAAGRAGIDADMLALIAPVVLLATQVPGMLLGYAPPVGPSAPAGPTASLVGPAEVPSPREAAPPPARADVSGRRGG